MVIFGKLYSGSILPNIKKKNYIWFFSVKFPLVMFTARLACSASVSATSERIKRLDTCWLSSDIFSDMLLIFVASDSSRCRDLCSAIFRRFPTCTRSAICCVCGKTSICILCVIIYVFVSVPADVPWYSFVHWCSWIGLLREAAVFLFVVATFSRLSALICSLRL